MLNKIPMSILCLFCLATIHACSKNDEISTNSKIKIVKMPDEMFGINFCADNTVFMKNTVKTLLDKGIPFTAKSTQEKIISEKYFDEEILSVTTKHFIGSGISPSDVYGVEYFLDPFHDELRLEIEISNKYFDLIFQDMKKRFGAENINVPQYYGQYEWSGNPDMRITECIATVTFAKNQAKNADSMYLIIAGRPHGKVH